MKSKLTILCENSVGVPFGVIGEHGFACFVETEKGNYLFDTGQGFAITQNAQVLGKDLSRIEAIMISHGHYDHTGGLPAVLKIRGAVDVFGHPDMFTERIWSSGNETRFIGIPFRRPYLEHLGARFRLGTEMVEVGPGVYLTGEIPRKSAFEKGDAKMSAIRPDGETIHPDPIKDDLSLIIDSDKGLIIVLGCAHAGMINIIEYALAQMKKDRIHAIIGGTHLGFSSDEQFNETLKVIDHYKIDLLGVSHCTGLARASMLHARLKDRFFFGTVGSVLEV
jgi:7,8-dihydropterin-6-yl-methyl-4-(beta-D-ribofuranosyl)aminobenzene 5'-phosphate synthase